MKLMKFRLTSTTDTWEMEASCWTDLMEKLRVLTLSSLVKVERVDDPFYKKKSQQKHYDASKYQLIDAAYYAQIEHDLA